RQWPGDSTATLQTIAQRLPEGAARQSIRDLDNALYGQKHNDVSEVFDKQSMAQLPIDLRQAIKDIAETSGNSQLRTSRQRGATILPEIE
ncbi:MAG: hypothetical protein KTR32_32170, partial [Granulosicoccus sp.]|nr:hypothetical protein [Granulosicoccus sp.]